MLEILIIFVTLVITLIIIPGKIINTKEKKEYNNGVCRKCGGELRHFDEDSQGGHGYNCLKCNNYYWFNSYFTPNKTGKIIGGINMANWCENIISITGDDNQLEDLLKLLKSEESQLDFGKVVSKLEDVPESMKNYPSYLLSELECSKDESIYNNATLQRACWGTKWLPDEPYINHDLPGKLVISFLSAWRPYDTAIVKLSEFFPELEFNYMYHEAGCDFSGFVIAKNGLWEDFCYDYKYDLSKCNKEGNHEFEEENELYKSALGEFKETMDSQYEADVTINEN